MSPLKGLAAAAGVLATLLGAALLSGCNPQPAMTGGGSPTLDDLTLKPIPQEALAKIADAAKGGDTDAATVSSILNGANAIAQTANGYSASALSTWNSLSAQTYSSGGKTYSWFHQGTSWTWNGSWLDPSNFGTVAIAIRASLAGGQWAIEIDVNGQRLFAGNSAGRGSTGNVNLYDLSDATSSSYTMTWQPDSSGTLYTTDFVVTQVSPTGQSVRLDTNDDGSESQFTLQD